MTTFKQFISEQQLQEGVVKKWYTSSMEVKDAITFLNTNAKAGLRAIQTGELIYRGFRSKIGDKKSAFYAIDSSTGVRTSRDTDNLYQLMMSESQPLKAAGIHDRHKSMICSSGLSTADGYGDIYVVVPLDGSSISVSDVDDIFNTYVKSSLYRGEVNPMETIQQFLKRIGTPITKGVFNDASAINAYLAKFDPVLLALKFAEFGQDMSMEFDDADITDTFERSVRTWSQASLNDPKFLDVKKHFLSGKFEINDVRGLKSAVGQFYKLAVANPKSIFTAMSSVIFTPKTINVKSVKYGESLPRDVECWFAGKAILISEKVFTGILRELQKNKFPISRRVLDDWEYNMTEVY